MRMKGLNLLARPLVRRGLVALIGAEAVVVGLIYQSERSDLKARQNQVTYGREASSYFRKYPSKGLTTPPAIQADEAGLDPSEEVVGVIVGGRARAYRLEALRDRDRHVVNDVVGGVPVSVVFCDLSNCVRAYTQTDPKATKPLEVASAGLIDGGEMVVTIAGINYLHSTGRPVSAEALPRPVPRRSRTRPPPPSASPGANGGRGTPIATCSSGCPNAWASE